MLIGDIGINHEGNVGIAISLAKTFAPYLDYVKLQLRTPDLCVPEHIKENAKVNPFDGETMMYIEYKHENELSFEDLLLFDEVMNTFNIKWFASVWDVPSLERLLQIKPDVEYIKIPSAKCHNEELSKAIKDMGLMYQTIVSLGDNKSITDMIVNYFEQWDGAIPSYCLPIYDKDCYIPKEYTEFYHKFSNIKTKMYSTHSGRLRDIENALTVGYDMIEFHITHSKDLIGSDHKSSLVLEQVKTLQKTNTDIQRRTRLVDRSSIWSEIDKKLVTLR